MKEDGQMWPRKRRYCESEGERGKHGGGEWISSCRGGRLSYLWKQSQKKCAAIAIKAEKRNFIKSRSCAYSISSFLINLSMEHLSLLSSPSPLFPFPSVPMSGPSIELSPDRPWQSFMLAKLVSCNVSSPLVLCKPQGSVFL